LRKKGDELAAKLALPLALRPLPRVALQPWRLATLLALIYALLAGGYIVYSSKLAASIAPTLLALERMEQFKGLAFVVVTTAIFWGFAWIVLRRIRRQEELIARQMEALARADRSMIAGMFAAAMAHDVRNALMVAMIAAEEISGLAPQGRSRAESADDLTKSLEAISNWMERLLLFSSEKFSRSEETFDVVEQVRSATELCRKHTRLFNRTLDVVTPDRPLEMRGIPQLVNRALFNLILNAADATAEGGRIRVSVETAEGAGNGDVVLRVEDNGPGVPLGDRETILQPFYTSKGGGGAGLGLISFVACAEQHHGELEVGDSPLGGARFELRLPVKAA